MDDVTFEPQQTEEEQAARIALSDMDGLAKKAHEMRGQPFNMPNLTPEQALWAWMYTDDSVDHNALLAQGLKPSEVADRKFPFQRMLMEQAGTSFDEQNAYAQHETARAMRAYQTGRVPKPPARGPQNLSDLAPPIAAPGQPAAPQPQAPQPPADPTQMQPGGM